jgi:protein-L-isoaspartate(D-aspartate) O-methyltransferase
MVDFAQMRRIMVDSQVRTFDVTSIPLIDVLDQVPRERFVLPGREDLAYIDRAVPVSEGRNPRYMLTCEVMARMIQGLRIEPGMKVLDIACGRGYSSAVLAGLGANVIALESDPALAETARQVLAGIPVEGVQVASGALDQGLPDEAPFDAILVNGAADSRPDILLEQLADGGRLACVIGQGNAAKAMLYVRSSDATSEHAMFDAAATMLEEFAAKPAFVF